MKNIVNNYFEQIHHTLCLVCIYWLHCIVILFSNKIWVNKNEFFRIKLQIYEMSIRTNEWERIDKLKIWRIFLCFHCAQEIGLISLLDYPMKYYVNRDYWVWKVLLFFSFGTHKHIKQLQTAPIHIFRYFRVFGTKVILEHHLAETVFDRRYKYGRIK